ncbi:MAG: aldehyde ferredoxin oxidoreductase family protein [Proteobacteria bacterium]|nr:aldehyde ferredoxin oxidoreductase family protein [Pseudomonadota bacterium]
MGKGYMGKILMVDLSSGKIEEEIVPDEVYENYCSGVGLASRLLYDRIPAGADPLGPDNILGLVSGLLTGTGTLITGRWMAVGKSPLTGGWGDANAGGKFSPAIKRSGYDGIFFKGISSKPVYLKVIDGKAELVDAAHVWGMDVVEADEKLKEEIGGKRIQLALIGPAGEKQSLISGIVNDKARIAARSGLGAVMGSKKLKGVAVGGKQKVQVEDPEKVKELNKQFTKWFKKGQGLAKFLHTKVLNMVGRMDRVNPMAMALSGGQIKLVLKKYGTIVGNVLSSEKGDSPVMNWKGSGFKDYPIATHSNKINPQRIIDYEIKKYACHSCPIGCGGIVEVNDGSHPVGKSHKPEYETSCAFGTLLLNNDLHSIFKINDMLNRAGMDTISAGTTVAWAIECYDTGVLTKEELDGIDLTWGNSDAIIEMVEKMINRDGVGDLLADGCKRAVAKFGKGEEYAMHAGGQELPMHDSRFDPGFAVSYALEPTPGRHTNHGFQWLELFSLNKLFEGLPKMPHMYSQKSKYKQNLDRTKLLVVASNYMQFVNSVGACLFGIQLDGKLNLPAYTNAVTGWNHPHEHYLVIGERIQNLRQAFNIKHGIKPLHDYTLPSRALGKPPLIIGPLKGITIEQEMFDDYLEMVGWDVNTGIPTEQKLKELALDNVAADLRNMKF